MLHRLNPSLTDPQSVPFVRAVVDAEPMRKRIYVAYMSSVHLDEVAEEAYKADCKRYEVS